ncbi:hypothetical protein DIPPA_11726 [Diplonema papillatum]|nr:hypothetical protein DIPPA_11726 [Diplonema papillatum]
MFIGPVSKNSMETLAWVAVWTVGLEVVERFAWSYRERRLLWGCSAVGLGLASCATVGLRGWRCCALCSLARPAVHCLLFFAQFGGRLRASSSRAQRAVRVLPFFVFAFGALQMPLLVLFCSCNAVFPPAPLSPRLRSIIDGRLPQDIASQLCIIDCGKHPNHPLLFLVERIMGGGSEAITFLNYIYMPAGKHNKRELRTLVVHEATHTLQYKASPSVFFFLAVYLSFFASGLLGGEHLDNAYVRIPAEMQAFGSEETQRQERVSPDFWCAFASDLQPGAEESGAETWQDGLRRTPVRTPSD